MDAVTILIASAAAVLCAAAGWAAGGAVVKRRLFPPEVRSVVFAEPAKRADRRQTPGPALLRELTQPVRSGGSPGGGPAIRIFVKPGRAAAEILIIDQNGAPVECALIDDNPRQGDVYLGKVLRTDSGFGGVFVDIGEDEDALLRVVDPVAADYAAGDRVLCQLSGLPRGRKGYKASDRIVVAGRHMKLLQGRPDLKSTRNLYDNLGYDDAEQLTRRFRQRCADAGRGVIVGEEGAASRSMYEKDFGFLMNLMDGFERCLEDGRGPAPLRLLHKTPDEIAAEKVLSALGRPETPVGSVTVVGGWGNEFVKELKKRRGRRGPRTRAVLKTPRKSVYNREEIERPLEKMREHLGEGSVKAQCPSGANLVIEQTEALISVDVNSAGARRRGGETDHDYALRINTEATDTLARMLRLINLGGIVVVDYLKMGDEGRRLLQDHAERSFALHEPVLRKPAGVDLGTVSPATGVLDLIRRRDGYSMWDNPGG